MTDRLLDIDILPGLHRPDATQGVPVVGRCRADNIDAWIGKRLAHVAHVFRFELLFFRHLLTAALAHLLVDVNHVQHRRARVCHVGTEVILAASAHAHHRDSQCLVGMLSPGKVRSHGNRRGSGQRITQEATA